MNFLTDFAPSIAIIVSVLGLFFTILRYLLRLHNEMRSQFVEIKDEFKELKDDVSEIKIKVERIDTELTHVKDQLIESRAASKEEHQKLNIAVQGLNEKVYTTNGEIKRILGHLFGASDLD